MSALDNQLDAACEALRFNLKGLTVVGLSREIKLPYHTAFRLMSMLRIAGEIEAAVYAPTGTHQAQIWKLRA
jgi:hypothetical protein